MDRKKMLIEGTLFVLCVFFILGLMFVLSYPVVNALDECEKRGWDGSEYNTGVKDVRLFEKSEDIIVKCTKAPKETDAMIDVFDALPGINIKHDVNVPESEVKE